MESRDQPVSNQTPQLAARMPWYRSKLVTILINLITTPNAEGSEMVDQIGIKPTTSSLRTMRSIN